MKARFVYHDHGQQVHLVHDNFLACSPGYYADSRVESRAHGSPLIMRVNNYYQKVSMFFNEQ